MIGWTRFWDKYNNNNKKPEAAVHFTQINDDTETLNILLNRAKMMILAKILMTYTH